MAWTTKEQYKLESSASNENICQHWRRPTAQFIEIKNKLIDSLQFCHRNYL